MAELKWRPGPARDEETEVYCGDTYLVAVGVCTADRSKYWWQYAVVTIEECGVSVGGEPWEWDWSDVEWFVPTKELAPGEAT